MIQVIAAKITLTTKLFIYFLYLNFLNLLNLYIFIHIHIFPKFHKKFAQEIPTNFNYYLPAGTRKFCPSKVCMRVFL